MTEPAVALAIAGLGVSAIVGGGLAVYQVRSSDALLRRARLEMTVADAESASVAAQVAYETEVDLERGGRLLARVQSEAAYRELRQYTRQALVQSSTAFKVSIAAAIVGFAVIVGGVVVGALTDDVATSGAFVGSGAILDAVALLFQSLDKRRQELFERIFDRLVQQRNVDEALDLVDQVADTTVKSSLQAAMALHLAGAGELASVHQQATASLASLRGAAATTDEAALPVPARQGPRRT